MPAHVDKVQPVQYEHGLEQICPHSSVGTVRRGILYSRIIHAQMIQATIPKIWTHVDLEAVERHISLRVLILYRFVVACCTGRDEESGVQLLLAR